MRNLMCTNVSFFSQEYHEARGLTPQEFAAKHAGLGDAEKYVSVVNDPRNT